MLPRRVRLLASCLTVALASGQAAQADGPFRALLRGQATAEAKAPALPLPETEIRESAPAGSVVEKTGVSSESKPTPTTVTVVPAATPGCGGPACGSCAKPCCDSCASCARPACNTCCQPACRDKGAGGGGAGDELFWVTGEYLLWFVKSANVAFPLATTASPGGAPPGALDTRVLFGHEGVNGHDPYSGLRLRAGAYSDGLGLGFDAAGFMLEQKSTHFGLASDAASHPVIARPFLNTATNTEAVNYLSFPNTVTGGVTIAANTQFWGAEANLSRRVGLGPVEMLYVGFRYLTLEDDLSIDDRSKLVPGGLGFFKGLPVDVGDVRLKNDFFRTQNDFYGGQVGMRAAYRAGRFDVNLRSAVGFGVNVEKVTVRGSTTLIPAGGGLATTVPGGLLALGSNSRDESRSDFAVVPEVDLSFGYQVAPWARLFVGYNFLYVSSVVRAGEQMERNVNPIGLPISPTFDPTVAAVNPKPVIRSTDFWTQGLNFGVGVSF